MNRNSWIWVIHWSIRLFFFNYVKISRAKLYSLNNFTHKTWNNKRNIEILSVENKLLIAGHNENWYAVIFISCNLHFLLKSRWRVRVIEKHRLLATATTILVRTTKICTSASQQTKKNSLHIWSAFWGRANLSIYLSIYL